MNTPYVKKFDKNGKLTNEIKSVYESEFPNRKERRSKPKRFKGNKKGISLTVVKTEKYKRVSTLIQNIIKGKKQTVENNHIQRKVINSYS